MQLFAFVFFSCGVSKKTKNDLNDIHLKQLNFDSEWKDSLENIKQEVKNSWIQFVNGDWNSFQERYGVVITKDDILNLELIPVEIFIIDSVAFANLDTSTPIENIITLMKDKAKFFVVKDKEFVASINSITDDAQWEASEYGGIAHTLAPKLSELYFEKKYLLYTIGINSYPSQSYIRYFNVFIEDGEFKSLSIFGKTKPFIDELLEYREYLKSVE